MRGLSSFLVKPRYRIPIRMINCFGQEKRFELNKGCWQLFILIAQSDMIFSAISFSKNDQRLIMIGKPVR
ncbi:hypothetical protein VSVS12_03485 [Vibrio scophthalmi]|nr:hypothetical protein VSVS12_03485 [Vibrio scophthalmi]